MSPICRASLTCVDSAACCRDARFPRCPRLNLWVDSRITCTASCGLPRTRYGETRLTGQQANHTNKPQFKTPWLYRGARHSIIRPSPPRVGVVQLVRTTLRSQSHHKLKYVVNEMTRKVSLFRDGDATGICNNYLSVRYVCIPRIEHRWSERCVKSSVTYLSAIRGEEL